MRLSPDMFNLARQVRAATDHAANAAGRLAGKELLREIFSGRRLDELIEKRFNYYRQITAACCPLLAEIVLRSWAGRPHLVTSSSRRVFGNSRKKLAAGPRVLAKAESSRQSGTKQGVPPHDHWAKLG